jgi:hypothetical protein
MSFDESLEVEIFDEERSRETVIDFVQTHPECIAQDIVDGQTEVGRKKVFRILRDLKKEKIISEVKLKSKRRVRNKPLLINEANPYTVVVTELKTFEKIYFSILDKIVNACNNERYLHDWKKIQSTNRQKIEHSKDFDDVIEEDLDDVDDFLVEKSYAMYLGLQPPNIFYGFLDVYMVRLVTNWSREIRNKDVLNKVNSMIFAKFAFMQNHTNKIIASISSSESIGLSYMLAQMNTIDQLKEKLKNLKEYDMEKEVNQLSKFIDRLFINEETRLYFRHKKGRLYRWDLKYKKDDLKELADDMRRHQDYINDGYYSDTQDQ